MTKGCIEHSMLVWLWNICISFYLRVICNHHMPSATI